jgi:glycerol-3-phosphate acyltransferase PlsY
MSMLFIYILLIIASYFLGAIPFMILIGRMRGVDLSHEPDLHHALWYRVGRPWGMLGFLLDILKGVVPVLAGFLLGFPLAVNALAGLAALCGQMWPVFRRFDGERGNTVSVGINFTLSFAYGVPLIFIIALAIALAGFFIRTALRWKASGSNLNERLRLGGSPSLVFPLAVIIGFASCPITSALLGQPLEMTLAFAGVVMLILVRRLTAGLMADLRGGRNPRGVVVNRLLFDRSER